MSSSDGNGSTKDKLTVEAEGINILALPHLCFKLITFIRKLMTWAVINFIPWIQQKMIKVIDEKALKQKYG